MSPNPGHWNVENLDVKKAYLPIVPADASVLTFEHGEGEQKLDWVNIPASDLTRYPGRIPSCRSSSSSTSILASGCSFLRTGRSHSRTTKSD